MALFPGAVALDTVSDNAALTHFGSLIEGITKPAKYLLVAGAIVLKRGISDEAIGLGGMLLGAPGPAVVVARALLFENLFKI